MPDRVVDLELRVSMPIGGSNLPIVLLSHGHGKSNFLSSLKGCQPLADFWASNGFVVIQPTHLNSSTLGLNVNNPAEPLFWRSRVHDMKRILDGLDELEAAIPQLKGRWDRNRIAAAGYSLGGHTVSLMLGMTIIDQNNENIDGLSDSRIKAGVLLAAPGNGADMTPAAAKQFPFLSRNSFTNMKTQALIVNGDKDVNPNFTLRSDWRADAYKLSPGPKSLLTVFGGEHSLGGISGYDAAETSDESPQRADMVERLTCAYLTSAFDETKPAWRNASSELNNSGDFGHVESK